MAFKKYCKCGKIIGRNKTCPDCAKDSVANLKKPEPFYLTKTWRAVRKQILLRDNFLCVICKRKGNEVDHIKPIKEGGDRYAHSNLQTLCKACHTRKTRRETYELA